jgi:hypothetical protein
MCSPPAGPGKLASRAGPLVCEALEHHGDRSFYQCVLPFQLHAYGRRSTGLPQEERLGVGLGKRGCPAADKQGRQGQENRSTQGGAWRGAPGNGLQGDASSHPRLLHP